MTVLAKQYIVLNIYKFLHEKKTFWPGRWSDCPFWAPFGSTPAMHRLLWVFIVHLKFRHTFSWHCSLKYYVIHVSKKVLFANVNSNSLVWLAYPDRSRPQLWPDLSGCTDKPLKCQAKFVADDIQKKIFFIFQRKEVLTFCVNHLPSRWFTWNVKTSFLWKKKKKNLLSAAVVIGVLRIKLEGSR